MTGTTKAQFKWQAARRLAKAENRWFDRQSRIDARPKIPFLDCAWAAGHFEGEGTVTLTQGGRMRVRPLVVLSSTDESCVEFFHQRWSGGRRSFLPKGNSRLAHVWNLNSGERIQIFLLDILPFVKTERVRQKIAVVLDDIQDRGLYQQQLDVVSRSEQRRLLIRHLNAKGMESVTVTGDISVMLPLGSKGDGAITVNRMTA